MSKPSTKQKPPPYPRPVEYVCADEIAPRLDDLAYQSRLDKRTGELRPGEPDTEDEAERRAKKRRRIESYASACLRGEPLYIMSAQLKGPFDKSWKNPWAKKRVGQAIISDKPKPEVPETVQKKVDTIQRTKDKRGAILEARKRYLALKSESREGTPVQRSSNGIVPPTSPITESAKKSPSREIIPKVGEVSATRVKDWLRTNEDFLDDSGAMSASPTPTMSRTISKQPSIQNPNSAVQTRSSVQANEENGEANASNPHATPHGEGSLSTNVARKVQQFSEGIHHAIGPNSNPSYVSSEAVTERIPIASVEDVAKADSTVLKSKHVALHVAPSEANFSPFEYKRATIRDLVTAKHDHAEQQYLHDAQRLNEASNTRLESPRVAQKDQNTIVRAASIQGEVPSIPDGHRPAALQQESPKDPAKMYDQPVADKESAAGIEQIVRKVPEVKEINISSVLPGPEKESSSVVYQQSRPVESTATSDINTIDLLPSAQRPPELVPGFSSEFGEHSLLENTTGQTDSVDDQNSDHTPIELASDHDVTPRTSLSEAQQQHPAHGSSSHISGSVATPAPAADIPLVPSSPAVPPSTQEMLAGITPLTFSTIKKRTITTLQETPVTATKKKRKTASFAPDLNSSTSSHGSIQSTMRGKISKKLTGPPPLIVKDSMYTEMLDDDASRPQISQSLPKGILKPTSSPNSLRQSKISLFSGCERDRHTATSDIPMGSGQNNGLDDEAFDLDAAISEIGSFLSPWAVDKEIEGMAV